MVKVWPILPTVNSWFEGDSWLSDDTFTETKSLVEFEDTGDGVVSDTLDLSILDADW